MSLWQPEFFLSWARRLQRDNATSPRSRCVKNPPILALESLETRLNPAMSIFENQVTNLYEIILHRAPDSAGLAQFSARLQQGQPVERIAQDLFHSHERHILMVTNHYYGLLNRAPDPAGLAAFTALADQGGSEKTIMTSLLASPEFVRDKSSAQFVSELYYVLLNRAADPSGLAAHTSELSNGLSREGLIQAFLNSVEMSERIVVNLYGELLGRQAATNEIALWSRQLSQPSVDFPDVISAFPGSVEGATHLRQAGLGAGLPRDLWWRGFVGISLDAAKSSVQELSVSFADLIRQRKDAVEAMDDSAVAGIDKRLAVLETNRYQALTHVVLVANPQAREIDRAKQELSVPVPGNQRGTIRGTASPVVAWHALNLTSVMGQFMDQSRGVSPDPGLIATNQTIAGSSNWSSFYPYPGDYDWSEEWDIQAPTKEVAANRVVKAFLDYAVGQSNANYSNFEFWRLRINYHDPLSDSDKIRNWTLPELIAASTDPALQAEMQNQLLNLNGKRIGFNFRGILDDGRFTHMQKVIGVHAFGPAGEAFFDSQIDYPNSLDGYDPQADESETFFRSQAISAKYQEIFVVGRPSQVDPETLGEYGYTMWRLGLKEVSGPETANRYLKAANRAFAYFRAIGNVEAMEAIQPVYKTAYSLMNQRNQMLDTVADALDSRYPSRILSAAKAREQLLGAADVLESLEGGSYSDSLRQIAASLTGTDGTLVSPLQPDSTLETQLNEVDDGITLAINARVADMVRPVIDKYLRNFHQ